jgi:hypothetical protein
MTTANRKATDRMHSKTNKITTRKVTGQTKDKTSVMTTAKKTPDWKTLGNTMDKTTEANKATMINGMEDNPNSDKTMDQTTRQDTLDVNTTTTINNARQTIHLREDQKTLNPNQLGI